MDENTEEFEGEAGRSSISADLIRGHINTIILRSLYDRDKYGYEIITEINEKSHGQYTLKQPTLYSALKRLENQGYIQAYWKADEVSAGGRRKYYRLTDSGKEIAEQNRSEWEYSRTVIDSLISDRNFDFNQPAPTPVDFKILKQATSRVPVLHGEGEDGEEKAEAKSEEKENSPEGKSGTDSPVIEARTYTVSDESSTVYIEDPLKASQDNSKPEEQNDNKSDGLYSAKAEKALEYSELISEGNSSTQTNSAASEYSSESAPKENTSDQTDSLQNTSENTTDISASPAAESSAAESNTLRTETSEESATQTSETAAKNDTAEMYSEVIRREIRDTIREELNAAVRDLPAASQESYSEQTTYSETVNEPYAQQVQRNPQYAAPSQEEKARYASQLSASEENDARRRAHENYLKLISGDEKKEEDKMPYADSIDTSRLIYNARPEQERDYKNLIDKLFANTLKNTPAPAPAVQETRQAEPAPREERVADTEYAQPQREERVQTRYSAYSDANKKAASDGLKISTSEEAFAAGVARQSTYNKGATLFKCSLIIGVIMLLEFTLTLLFMNELHVSIAYPIIILSLGLALVLVCGILFGAKYGNHMRKPTSLRYISTACIITILLICIIIVFAIVINVNWSETMDVLAKIVIPCIIALNIPIFTLSFYLFTK